MAIFNLLYQNSVPTLYLLALGNAYINISMHIIHTYITAIKRMDKNL